MLEAHVVILTPLLFPFSGETNVKTRKGATVIIKTKLTGSEKRALWCLKTINSLDLNYMTEC